MSDSRHPRWHELRTMLTDWLTWLDETQRWVEATANTNRHEGCGQDVDETVSESTASQDIEAATPRPDLLALLSTMTALRQGVTLQTRSARRDREQAATTLEELSGLVTQLEQERQDNAQRLAAQAADHIHVDALLDLHDALSRAERQAGYLIASTTATLRDWSAQKQVVDVQVSDGQRDDAGWWRRWFGRSHAPDLESKTLEEHPTQPASDGGPEVGRSPTPIEAEVRRMADRLDALTTGYGLSVQRLERLLLTCGIEPIVCIDKSVDPELMEVVQVVADHERAPGTVIDEVRRGYLRHQRLYRFAQVVATRADPLTRLESGPPSTVTDDTTTGDSG